MCSVHPRVRGEYRPHVGVRAITSGSSPRARGIPEYSDGGIRWRRFIPACAGNTGGPGTARTGTAVHPRVRGEYSTGSPGVTSAIGSSPRARGIRDCGGPARGRGRFIPACAGNTSTSALETPCAAVHPRVRGEYQISRRPIFTRSGSSPRARGIRRGPPARRTRDRFIPACAGNTMKTSLRGVRGAVHPRVRGEYISAIRAFDSVVGSSPRARGILVQKKSVFSTRRFIPACAGNTPTG